MRVHYMNGAGNDFMVIDARGQKLDFPALARQLCKLTGADGFMAVDESDTADFRLHFYKQLKVPNQPLCDVRDHACGKMA